MRLFLLLLGIFVTAILSMETTSNNSSIYNPDSLATLALKTIVKSIKSMDKLDEKTVHTLSQLPNKLSENNHQKFIKMLARPLRRIATVPLKDRAKPGDFTFRDCSLSPDGSKVYIHHRGEPIHIFNSAGKDLSILESSKGYYCRIEWSPRGTYVIGYWKKDEIDEKKEAKIWNSNNQALSVKPIPSWQPIRITSNEKYIIFKNDDSLSWHIIDIKTGIDHTKAIINSNENHELIHFPHQGAHSKYLLVERNTKDFNHSSVFLYDANTLELCKKIPGLWNLTAKGTLYKSEPYPFDWLPTRYKFIKHTISDGTEVKLSIDTQNIKSITLNDFNNLHVLSDKYKSWNTIRDKDKHKLPSPCEIRDAIKEEIVRYKDTDNVFYREFFTDLNKVFTCANTDYNTILTFRTSTGTITHSITLKGEPSICDSNNNLILMRLQTGMPHYRNILVDVKSEEVIELKNEGRYDYEGSESQKHGRGQLQNQKILITNESKAEIWQLPDRQTSLVAMVAAQILDKNELTGAAECPIARKVLSEIESA